MRRPIVMRMVVMLLLGTSLSGCLLSMDDLNAYIQEVRSRKTTKIEPIPQMKPYQAFAYVSGSRRDPFLPTAPQRSSSSNANASLRPDLNRNKEPLEEFPLDALQMVGLIDFKGKAYAMVKAPDGVVHRVSVGDHLGQNYGTINKISPSEISLTEIIPDGFGGWVERPASLALAD